MKVLSMKIKKNQDARLEKTNPQSRELSDQELEQATGGQIDVGAVVNAENKMARTDSQGRATHWYSRNGGTYHFTCPTCGRILHEGSFGLLYCDPCDEWYTSSGANRVEES